MPQHAAIAADAAGNQEEVVYRLLDAETPGTVIDEIENSPQPNGNENMPV
jgi:hypothetical protein